MAGRLIIAPTELLAMHWYRPSSARPNDPTSSLDDVTDVGEEDAEDRLLSVIPSSVHVILTSSGGSDTEAGPAAWADAAFELVAVQYSVTSSPRRTTDERGSRVKYGADAAATPTNSNTDTKNRTRNSAIADKQRDVFRRIPTPRSLIPQNWFNKLCGKPPKYAPTPCDLDLWRFDLESGVRVSHVWRGLPLCQFWSS